MDSKLAAMQTEEQKVSVRVKNELPTSVETEHNEERKGGDVDSPKKKFKGESSGSSEEGYRMIAVKTAIEEPRSESTSEEKTRQDIPLEEEVRIIPACESFKQFYNDTLNRVKGLWIIESLADRIKSPNAQTLQSPSFVVPNGSTMHLELHLNTRAVQKHKSLGLYFFNRGPVKEFKVMIAMYVKSLGKRGTRNGKKEKYVRYLSNEHVFDEECSAWGNAKFMPLIDLRRNDVGKMVRIQFIVKLMKSPRDLPAGCASGLLNHGSTCYANSLLQVLNSIKLLKKAVWSIKTTEDEIGTSAYALQRIFYNMSMHKEPRGTKELLYTFGWTDSDLCMQRDIQEFKCLLCGVLEQVEPKLNSTFYQSIFKHLLEGNMTMSIQCTDIDCRSSKTETFADLSLDVKDCSNIYESFDKYSLKEEMSGENSYLTEGKGLQKAYKTTKIASFPPVLFLHLKRFEYKDTIMDKIHDRFEFGETLELSKYCTETGDKSYRLHAVIVHKGSTTAGHYFAFIKQGKCWVRYDDKIVTHVDAKEAVNENFGGKHVTILINDEGNVVVSKKRLTSSAYMLVYIETRKYKLIQEEIDLDKDLPKELRERFEAEERILSLDNEDTAQSKNLVCLYITTTEMLHGWIHSNIGPGLSDSENEKGFLDNSRYRLKLFCKPSQTLGEVLEKIRNQIGASDDSIEVWLYEVQPYGFNFLTKKRCDLSLEVSKCSTTAGKVRGIFLACQHEGRYKEMCVKIPPEERGRRQSAIQAKMRLLEKMKCISDLKKIDSEIPQWKFTDSIAKQKDANNLLQSFDSKTEPAKALKLVFVKYCDLTSSMGVLLGALILPTKTPMSAIAAFAQSISKIDEMLEMCEETAPSSSGANNELLASTKKINVNDKVDKLKEGAIIICHRKVNSEK
eukprot:TRINITY_DN9673_c0_g1_i25.p1 TRINITY_DN9673_c0_g1~~TRINITY_DN9673_c0_g1_i25.p1  ORF type:complete len:901 (-),score=204.71 TRINITY_DN9673_c0_g1_i25:211-2913(-)